MINETDLNQLPSWIYSFVHCGYLMALKDVLKNWSDKELQGKLQIIGKLFENEISIEKYEKIERIIQETEG